MASFNSCCFSGNLTRDIEVRKAGESEVGRFAIAVNGRKDRDETMYIDCDYWRPGKVAEYLLKGTGVIVGGELRMDSWEKDGIKRTKPVITVRSLTLVGGRKAEPREEAAEATPW